MRILLIAPVFPPYKGGMGEVAARHAALLERAGHVVEVVAPKRGAVCPFFVWGNAAIMSWGALGRRIWHNDTVYLHYPFFGTAFFVMFMARLLRKRLIVFWHMRATAEKGAWVRAAIFFVHRICEEPLMRRLAHRICASSDEYAEVLQLPVTKRVIIPFGVDAEKFIPRPHMRATMREVWNIPEDACVFLFVGGMDMAHAFKGIAVLLEAWSAFVPTHPLAYFVFCGEGNLRKMYEAQVQHLGVGTRVRFLGSVAPDVLPHVYSAADVHVLPSTSGAETYGLVTCEAGASGLPSIVSALPGVQSRVVHGQTGLHVKPGSVSELTEALVWMYTHPQERIVYGNAARVFMQKHASLEVERNTLLTLFEKNSNTNNER